jgi:AraC-like DNA-binding protein
MIVALFIWAFIQSFLFGGTILFYKNNQANRILAIFFILISGIIFFQYLLKYEFWLFDHPATLFIPDLINLSLGPILYLYSNQLIYRKWHNLHVLHFIPAFLFAVYYFLFEILPEERFEYVDYINTKAHIIVLSIILISNTVYLILFRRNYVRCRKLHLEENRSLKPWINILLIFFLFQLFINLVIWILHYVVYMSGIEYIARAGAVKDFIFIFLNAIIIFVTSFFVISNPSLIKTLGTKISTRLKSKPFAIGKDEAALHIAKLEQLMNNEKIFLDPQLTEKKFAGKLDLQPYYLSKLINQHVNCSFNEFINRARIDETKRLLESEKSEKLTLYAIALDSGFSSESVFYTNFKKYTGMTPAQYRKRNSVKK